MGCTNVSLLVVMSRCGYGRKRGKAIVHLSMVPLTTACDYNHLRITSHKGKHRQSSAPPLVPVRLHDLSIPITCAP